MEGTDPYCHLTEENNVAFTPHVYEIHGNVNYMHCSNEDENHSRIFKRAPTIEEFDAARAAAPNKKITNEDGIT